MVEPGLVECQAHRADPPVHHVGRGDDVAAGFGLDHRLAAQERHGLVVRDIALADHAVMAVRCKRVERHVAQHAEVRQRLFQRRDRAADEIAGVQGFAALVVLQRRRHRREDRDGRDAERRRLAGGIDQRRDRQPEDTGHRGNRRLPSLVMDKDRPDQVASGQHMLGDELARPGVAPVASEPQARIRGERRQKFGHGTAPGRAADAAKIGVGVFSYNLCRSAAAVTRAPISATDITWAVEAARMTRVA